MAQRIDVEVWVLVDSNGDYAAGSSQEQAKEHYEHDVQPVADTDGFRLVKVTVSVPLPQTAELTGSVADDGPAVLTAAK